MSRLSPADSPASGWVFLFAAMIVGSLVLSATIPTGAFHADKRVTLHKMVYHEADRPFVYRTLSPTIVRGLSALTPPRAAAAIRALWEKRGLDAVYRLPMEDAIPGTWTILLIYVCLVGFAFAMRAWLRGIYRLAPGLDAFGALLATALVPTFQPAYIYDITNLLLFTLCLIQLHRERWRLFYPLFILTCASKETSLLLPIVLVLNTRSREDLGRRFPHVALQGAIWAAISFGIRFALRHNPGDALEMHLPDNLAKLLTPKVYLSVGDFLLPRNLNILLIAAGAWLAAYGWKEKPFFLRRSALMLIPMLLLGMFFCVIDEARVFLEAYPVVYGLSLYGALKLAGGAPGTVDSP
jgi:hypothetical protein